jgi:hypothetical protein
VDRLRVRDDVRHRGGGVEHLGQVGHPPHLGEPLAVAQPRRDLYDIDGLALGAQLDAGLVDAAVSLRVEMLGLQELVDLVEGERIEHHRRENGGLGIEIVRGHPRFDPDRLRRLPRDSAQLLHRSNLQRETP